MIMPVWAEEDSGNTLYYLDWDVTEGGLRFMGDLPIECSSVGELADEIRMQVTEFHGKLELSYSTPDSDIKITGDRVIEIRPLNPEERAALIRELRNPEALA